MASRPDRPEFASWLQANRTPPPWPPLPPGVTAADYATARSIALAWPERKPLPRGQDPQEPVLARKLCGLTLVSNMIRFWGTGLNDPLLHYSADARATCYRDIFGYRYTYQVGTTENMVGTRNLPSHASPADHCTCGFYAHREPPATQGHWWGLEVELAGEGIEHKGGLRAERQRVLSVRAPEICNLCGHCTPPASAAYMTWQRSPYDIYGDAGVVIWAAHPKCLGVTAASLGLSQTAAFEPIDFQELRQLLAPVTLQVPAREAA